LLAAGYFDFVALFLEFCFQDIALITLYLYLVALNSPANAAFFLQGFCQGLEFFARQWETFDKGDGFSAAPFALPVQAYYPIAGAGRSVLPADALGHGSLALGTQAPTLS
jgi:hypothetical protein